MKAHLLEFHLLEAWVWKKSWNHDLSLYYTLIILADIFWYLGIFFLKCQNDALNNNIYGWVVRWIVGVYMHKNLMPKIAIHYTRNVYKEQLPSSRLSPMHARSRCVKWPSCSSSTLDLVCFCVLLLSCGNLYVPAQLKSFVCSTE